MTRIDLIDYATDAEIAQESIQRATIEGWTLNTYSDPTSEGREDCSGYYAVEVADADMSLVYLTR